MEDDKNKDLIQSYIFTTAKYDFSVYEKRILYRQIEIEQELLDGKKIGQGIKIDTNLWGNKRYTIPLKMLLKDALDKNYNQIEMAFKSLLKKVIEYEDDYTKGGFGIIQEYKIEKRSSFVSWVAHPKIVDATMDFAKGYRKYELKVAMKFESIYAMRFYELLSGQKTPLTYTIVSLKDMFGISEKYKFAKDFRIKVLDAAKKELDKASPYTFDYKMNKTGRAYTSVTFYPKYQPQFRDESLEIKQMQQHISTSWYLEKEEKDYLIHNIGFTQRGIKNNAQLLENIKPTLARNNTNLIEALAEIKTRAIKAKVDNLQGYTIGALKSILGQSDEAKHSRYSRPPKNANKGDIKSIGDLLDQYGD